MFGFWLFICFLWFPSCLLSTESFRKVEVKSIHEVAGDILFDTTNFWLILDIDDTLLEGAEALTHSMWMTKTIEGFQQLGFSEQESWETTYPYWLEFQEKGSVKPIEPAMKLLIEKIQEKGQPCFAYTERRKETQAITLKQLASVQIQFKPNLNLPDQLPTSILFASGILFGNEIHKGRGLSLFLDALTIHPEKIIYVDNDYYNVVRVGELCKSRNISFFGIVYRAQKFFPPIYLSEIAKIQYTYSKKLLSNEAAALLLRHQMIE
ncbi:HAD super, subIIIB family protein [Chlamydia ibidis]|uniref:HAD super, subIIIB family protein n=2 Tax=Chlamydia ibidis TaxID=1405396 RepID=S7J3E7_9CHLA|nr:DUF2608 domain-containing protein [Chlamydia ibidis]EPP34723.1 HAD super, subIIIB family protein [Chlamydia ibidis]EQM62405.1 HAD super, subIIIB family protein [Chlamydia ibidis 10-1398/6]